MKSTLISLDERRPRPYMKSELGSLDDGYVAKALYEGPNELLGVPPEKSEFRNEMK